MPPIDGHTDAPRLAGLGCELALGHAAGVGDGLILPGTAAAIPLIAAFDPEQLPFEPVGGGRFARLVEIDDIELGLLTAAERAGLEQWSDADEWALGCHLEGGAPLDGAPARLAQPHQHLGFKQARGARQGRQGHGEPRPALGVGPGQVFERGPQRAHALILEPEAIAGKAFDATLELADDHFALDGEIRGRRPVEIAPRELDGGALARPYHLLGGLECELQALGQEVLDQE